MYTARYDASQLARSKGKHEPGKWWRQLRMKKQPTNPFASNSMKGRTFTMERAAEIVGGAFKPLRCVATTVNFASRVEFEVTNGTKSIVRRRIPSDLAQKDYNLRSEIMRARQDVQDLGYELHTWEMPSA